MQDACATAHDDTNRAVSQAHAAEDFRAAYIPRQGRLCSVVGMHGQDARAYDEAGDNAKPAAKAIQRCSAYRAVKRTFDIAVSTVAIVLGAIPVALLCVAIRFESKGSPLYMQERMGKDGRPIRIVKLRSMYKDADNVEKYLTPRQLSQWKTERKVDDDPRITKIGRFIRATSIDEIPQFLNVFVGQLSVIGPRPITCDELELHFTPDQQRSLLSVRPGITGLWQTGERNKATFETGRRQQIELSYVHDASFALDWRIFWSTFGVMFGNKRSGR